MGAGILMEQLRPYRRGWNGFFELDGELLENTLGSGGQQQVLGSSFRGDALPAGYYLRLYQNSLAGGVTDPGPDHTLANLAGEISGGGYAPTPLARNTTDWPYLAYEADSLVPTNSGWRVRSKSLLLGPVGAGWTAFNYLVIATTTGSAGPLIAWAKTTDERILTDGQSLPVVYNVKLI